MIESWIADYEALTAVGGIMTFKDWSQVQLTGGDRVKFLHNMCTNDIRRLEPGDMCEAFCTDVKGKILAHVFVVADAERLILLTVPGEAERIIKHLDRYIIREDVQLADVSVQFDWHLMTGSNTKHIDDSVQEVSCDVLWPGGKLLQTAKGQPRFVDLQQVDTSSLAWTALRVESYFPLYGVDFDESHLPQEINRDVQAISFNKGCYLGQETVARIDALGHVNKKLVLVKFEGEQIPDLGSKLLEGDQEVGTVTTASWSPRLAAPLGIAMVRRGSNDVGSKLESEFGRAAVVESIVGVN